ncbi:TetR/AcrR family transcriptional regulator [Mycolicibacterium thermoresistibile]
MSVSDVTSTPAEAPAATAGPADRLLAAATKLFAAQGIRAVGIDRVLREAGVAKASLYASYGSKDGLVLAYLRNLDQADRNRWHAATESLDDPRDRILAFFDLAIAGGPERNYRGCQYANAATEFPDDDLPPVVEHREWVLDTLTDQLDALGVAAPRGWAAQIQVIYDGALAGSKMARSVQPIETGREMAAAIVDHALN